MNGTGHGTAFLVAHNIALTAAHNIYKKLKNPIIAQKVTVKVGMTGP